MARPLTIASPANEIAVLKAPAHSKPSADAKAASGAKPFEHLLNDRHKAEHMAINLQGKPPEQHLAAGNDEATLTDNPANNPAPKDATSKDAANTPGDSQESLAAKSESTPEPTGHLALNVSPELTVIAGWPGSTTTGQRRDITPQSLPVAATDVVAAETAITPGVAPIGDDVEDSEPIGPRIGGSAKKSTAAISQGAVSGDEPTATAAKTSVSAAATPANKHPGPTGDGKPGDAASPAVPAGVERAATAPGSAGQAKTMTSFRDTAAPRPHDTGGTASHARGGATTLPHPLNATSPAAVEGDSNAAGGATTPTTTAKNTVAARAGVGPAATAGSSVRDTLTSDTGNASTPAALREGTSTSTAIRAEAVAAPDLELATASSGPVQPTQTTRTPATPTADEKTAATSPSAAADPDGVASPATRQETAQTAPTAATPTSAGSDNVARPDGKARPGSVADAAVTGTTTNLTDTTEARRGAAGDVAQTTATAARPDRPGPVAMAHGLFKNSTMRDLAGLKSVDPLAGSARAPATPPVNIAAPGPFTAIPGTATAAGGSLDQPAGSAGAGQPTPHQMTGGDKPAIAAGSSPAAMLAAAAGDTDIQAIDAGRKDIAQLAAARPGDGLGVQPQNGASNGFTMRLGGTAHAPQNLQIPAAAFAMQIARKAANGESRFQIRLDPPELGRVDVKLQVSADGRVNAHLMVERSETLDLLQRDARHLERALLETGLKTGEGSLSFSLRDQGFAGSSRDGEGKTGSAMNPGSENAGEDPADQPETELSGHILPDSVDIRV